MFGQLIPNRRILDMNCSVDRAANRARRGTLRMAQITLDILNLPPKFIEGLNPVLVHGREIQDCPVSLESVDQDRERLQIDVVIFTVDFSQASVLLQHGGQSTRALKSKFLVLYLQDLEGLVLFQTSQGQV